MRGEILGIAGGSGSGKSVLLRTLVGLHRPDAGEVRLNGQPIETVAPTERASLIGVLFQRGALFSSLSVAQNIMLPIREHTDLPAREQETIAVMKLALAGMSAETGLKLPSELSGGMVKRAAFARALALDPHILFLDEPTADLDPLTASGIDTMIRGSQSQPGRHGRSGHPRSHDAVHALRAGGGAGRRQGHRRHARSIAAIRPAVDS